MNQVKGDSMCCEMHNKQTVLFGVTLLIIALLMETNVSIPGILMIVGAIFLLKGILTTVIESKK